MSTTVTELKGKIGFDISPLEQNLDRADDRIEEFAQSAQRKGEQAASRLSQALGKIDTGALNDLGTRMSVAITVPVLAAAGAGVKFASDTNESLSKVKAVFHENAGEIEAWSKNAIDNLGMTKGEALEAAGTFGNLFVAMKLGRDDAADMSKGLVQLATDLGSFNNVSADEALVALRAGLVGETEPLRRFGVNLSAATVEAKAFEMGLASSKEELTAGMKAQAAYALILEQTTTAQGDFARTHGELAGSTKQTVATIKEAAAGIAEDLLPVVKIGVSGVRTLTGAFTALPAPIKNTAVMVALTAAAVGPLLIGFANLIQAGKTLKDVKTSVSASLGILTGAKTAAAAATKAETAATVENAVAESKTVQSATVAEAARRKNTLAVWDEYRALEANSKAQLQNAMAQSQSEKGAAALAAMRSRGTLASRIGLGAPMFAGGLGANLMLGAGVVTGGVMGAAWLNDLQDWRTGRTTPGDWAKHLNPFRSGADDQRDVEQSAAEARREVEARWKTENGGLSPRQAMLKRQAEERAKVRAEVQARTDEQFAAELEQAKTLVEAAPEATRAQAEAKALIPLITKRAAELKAEAEKLKPQIGKSAEDAKDYWKLVREQAALQGDAEKLKQAAAKEAADAQKKAVEQARQTADALFAAQKDQAEAIAAAAPEGAAKRAEAASVIPVLVDRLKSLAEQARTTAAGSKEYAEISSEYWQIRGQITQLQKAATDEEQDQQKKAAADAKALHEAQFSAALQQAEALAAQAAEGYEARGRANEIIKVIDQKQQELVQQARTQRGQEYWATVKEYWALEAKAQQLMTAADKEAQAEEKKALEEAKKRRQEQKELMGLRTSLAQAQIANNPWLNERQKKQALAPFQAQQAAELLKPVEGETEAERIRRLTEANQLAGQAVENQLAGRRNPRMAAYLFREIERMGQAATARAAAPAAAVDPMAARAAIESRFYPGLPSGGGSGPPNITLQLNAPTQIDGVLYSQILADPRFQQRLWGLMELFRREQQAGQGYPRVPGLP